MKLFKALAVLGAAAALVLGQEFRATLSGRVDDGSGNGVAAAQVTLKNPGTGFTTTITSGDDGSYQFRSLTPGDYTLTVEKPGFKTMVREGIHLEVAARATADVTLSLGEVTQSITVNAGVEALETESADRGVTIGSQTVLSVPLMGRNPFPAAWSAPGVISTAGTQRIRPFDISGSSNMAINGSRPSTNEVLIDGVTGLIQASSVSYVPTADAISEFRVQNTNFDAQYGWTLGGIINMITKSGTNDFHGSLFEYFQNTHLNANTFNSNRTGVRRQSSHINTFGGDIGGPIKKNKLFFTYTFEDIRQVIPDPFIVSVPTALQRQGDFSQTYYARGANGAPLLQTIYDPFSTVTGPNGALVRTPYAGNVIPASQLDPVALKVLSYVPQGNVAGDSLTGLNNLTNNGSTRKFTDFFPEHTGRVDYNFSETARMFVRYSRNALTEGRSYHYSTVSAINPADTGQNNPFTRENHNATVQFSKTLNPTTVFDARAGLERFKSESGSAGGTVGPADLGFSPTFVNQAARWFPRFAWAGYDGAGAEPTRINPTAQTNTFQAMLAKSIGRDDLKFGGEFRLIRSYSQVPGYNAGNFTFDQLFTGANPLQIQPSSGNSVASFLAGVPQSGFIQVNSFPARQETATSLFVQNDVRVTDKLKLNLGLRWDYLGPLTDRFNQLPRGFDTAARVPLNVPGMPVYGGVLFSGVNGQPREIFNRSWGNLGPRFGAAYQLDSRTVLRGGYALIYGQTFNDPGNAPGFSQQTNMVTSIQAGVPFNTLDNPFPGGILQPAGSSMGLLTALGQSYTYADPAGGAPPYVHQYSFEVQREVIHDLILSAAYVASRSNRIGVTQQLNALSINDLALGSSALSQSVPNPFAGLLPGTALNGATVQRSQLLAPYPQFLLGSAASQGAAGIVEMFRPIGKSSYNSAQILASKRYSYGLMFTAAYTISKQIDQAMYRNPQDTRLEKVIAAWDVPQNLQINLRYELPFGAGKPFGSSTPGVVRTVIGGWEVSTLTRLQKGMPLDLTGSTNSVVLGNPALSNPALEQWFNTCTVLANGTTRGCASGQQPVWGVRPANTLQTWSSRLTSVRKPGIHNVDISLIKRTRLTERFNLLFRADFINAFNSPQFFSGPITDVNNSNFGRISGAMDQSNLPRFVQLSMKLQF
jgi:hypothetical protein